MLVLLQASIVEANIRRQNATQTVQPKTPASDNPCASGDSVITALNPYIGYSESARIAKLALATGGAIPDLVVQQGLLSAGEVAYVLTPEALGSRASLRR